MRIIKDLRVNLACLLSLMLFFLQPASSRLQAQSAVTGPAARDLFMKVYDSVYGEQGSRLSYSVNIIGIYKTKGTIYNKAGKAHFTEERYEAWTDQEMAYQVDKKKKEVNIYRSDDENRDKYLSKFKYDLSKFEFSYKVKGDSYEIIGKIPDSSFFGIRRLTAVVDRNTLKPLSLSVKLAIFSATVQITDFQSGGIPDDIFVFPRERFSGFTFQDHVQ